MAKTTTTTTTKRASEGKGKKAPAAAKPAAAASPKIRMRETPWITSDGKLISKPRPSSREAYEAWCKKYARDEVFTSMTSDQRASIRIYLEEWGRSKGWEFVKFRKAAAAAPKAKAKAKPEPAPSKKRRYSSSSSSSSSSDSDSSDGD